ncbi:hypothetical protein NP439_11820 [Oceanobacillus jeddahense]|uniref:Uncharacterized protein n=1 Tax=Oceanobacillus jeddahense TaxID=1462527 RepID=A0ABY5JZ25_9BACI|nr:hypothetical protein [Oceanobacillus jeddahense]UUI05281.1 hypothetical protein NP439_11820 [Oceanobacillus jeddahense]
MNAKKAPSPKKGTKLYGRGTTLVDWIKPIQSNSCLVTDGVRITFTLIDGPSVRSRVKCNQPK